MRTQRAFAERLGVGLSQVSDWENDRYPILEMPTLVRLGKTLGCSVDHLLAGIDPDYDRILEVGAMRADIPVVFEGDASPAGEDGSAERADVVRWVCRPGDVPDPEAYGIQICSESMVPAHRPDTIAIISPQLHVRNGDEVYAQLASRERLVRLAHAARGGCVLRTYNHTRPARFVPRKEIRAMHVILYSRRYF